MLKLLPFLPVTQHFKQMQFRSFKLQTSSGQSNCLIKEESTCASDSIQHLWPVSEIIKNQSSHIIIRFICDIISLCNIVRRTCMTYLILQSGICLPYSSSNSQRSICNSAEMYYMWLISSLSCICLTYLILQSCICLTYLIPQSGICLTSWCFVTNPYICTYR